MKSPYPQHVALRSLLQKQQYESCLMLVEERIEELMAEPSSEVTRNAQSSADACQLFLERERELAYLHTIGCRALHGLDRYEKAALAAEMAIFLARKARDEALLAEALHLAGVCYGQAGNYGTSIERHTECLRYAKGLFRAKVLYNRGHVYERQYAYAWAVRDFEEALQLSDDHDPHLTRLCRTNLAWDLIILREFPRAEALLAELEQASGAEADGLLQLQIAHDRMHMACLKGDGRDALRQALAALRQSGQQYPHVRAYIALTLMVVSADSNRPEQAFAMGILAKRLAGKAKRPDIDREASKRMEALELEAGTDCLVPALLRIREVTSGSINPTRGSKRGQRAGGVG